MTASAGALAAQARRDAPRKRTRPGRVALHVFLICTAVLWLAPVAWALFTSFRPYSDTAEHGYVSLPQRSASRTTGTPGRRVRSRCTSGTR